MMRYYGHPMMVGWGMLFFWIILIAILIFVVMKLFRKDKICKLTGDTKSNAINILDERYARGELSDEEYNNKKEQLKKQ